MCFDAIQTLASLVVTDDPIRVPSIGTSIEAFSIRPVHNNVIHMSVPEWLVDALR